MRRCRVSSRGVYTRVTPLHRVHHRKGRTMKDITRCITYARVSSDDTRKGSRNLEGQTEDCIECAKSKGYKIVASIQEDDKGASGASFDLPGIDEVLELAQQKEFDVLIVRELDRLSRNLAKQLVIEEELKRYSIRVEYVLAEYDDTPEGQLLKMVRAVIAEYERLKIKERTARGKRKAIKRGSILCLGHPPYGYQVIKEKISDEEYKFRLEPVDAEAEVIKSIFRWYLDGLGVVAISKKLAEARIPRASDIKKKKTFVNAKSKTTNGKPRGYAQWGKSTIYNILNNETYAGKWTFGKSSKNSSLMVTVEVPEIVDPAQFKAAQEKKEENKILSDRNNTKWEYLLARRLSCGKCGAAMTGSTTKRDGREPYMHYRCRAAMNQLAHDCDMPTFKVEQVDGAIWQYMKDTFGNNGQAFIDMLKDRQSKQAEHNKPLLRSLESTDKLLARNKAEMDRLVDLYISGEFEKDDLLDKKQRIKATIKSLERQKLELQEQIDRQVISDEQIDNVQSAIISVGEGIIKADKDFNKRRAIIDTLNVKVRLTVEDNDRFCHFSCILWDKEAKVKINSNNTRFDGRT